jgi:4-hydroxy-tetrahydrodipicolinate synthase
MMAVGACGIMNAAANVYPRALAEMCEAIWNGNLTVAQEWHHKLFDLNRAVQFDTNPIPVKYMMKRLGLLTNNEHRLPMAPALPELEKRLDAVLVRTGLLEEVAATAS